VAATIVTSLALLRVGGWLPAGGSGHAWLAGGLALGVGLAAGAVRVRRLRETPLQVARRVDRRLSLDDRLSTALEFGLAEGASAGTPPVLRSLFHEAAALGERIEPRAMVPLRLPRPVLPALLLLSLAIGLEAATPEPGVRAGTELTAGGEDPLAPEAIAELLRETAALLRAEGDRRQNEYMRVVATAMEKLALDIVTEGLSGEALGQALARIAAHAELAARSGATEVSGAPASAAGLADLPAWDGSDLMAERGATREGEPNAVTGRAQAGTLAQARAALDDLRSDLGGVPEDGDTAARAAASESMGEMAGGSLEMPFDPAQLQQSRAEGAQEGERPLANRRMDPQSAIEGGFGDGGSFADGVGSGLLSGMPQREALLEAASSQDFELPSEGGSRRRLPIEIVPETRFTEVEERAVARGDWRQTPEQRVSSDFIGIAYRSIASRYFLSMTEEPREAPEQR
jgi:hypothetical protein